jgi:hypothetical protein
MSLRAFFAKQSHHWEITTPQGERLRLAMTGTWVLMSDFLSEGQRRQSGLYPEVYITSHRFKSVAGKTGLITS